MATGRRAERKPAAPTGTRATAARRPPAGAARALEPLQGTRALLIAEPSAAYVARPPAVVDASLIAALVFAEPEMADARRHLLPYRPMAPTLLPLEIANVAMNKLRRGSGAAAELRNALADLDAMGLTLLAVEPLEVFDIASRWSLSAYDAAYLSLASTLRCPLLTFDRRLAEAARLQLGSLE
jgi:predicted nucleic acid-binding protein